MDLILLYKPPKDKTVASGSKHCLWPPRSWRGWCRSIALTSFWRPTRTTWSPAWNFISLITMHKCQDRYLRIRQFRYDFFFCLSLRSVSKFYLVDTFGQYINLVFKNIYWQSNFFTSFRSGLCRLYSVVSWARVNATQT